MKICSICNIEKSKDHYSMTKSKGIMSSCKPCTKQYHREYYLKNKERLSKDYEEYRKNNKEKIKLYGKYHRESNPDYYKNYSKSYYLENKEKIKEKTRLWRLENPEWAKENNKKFKPLADKAKNRSYTVKRQLRFRKSIPSWANMFFIEETYRLSILRTELTGITWNVDHIIPLLGENCSGLHVHNNLQVITKIENLKKGNRLIEDYL
jgi:hypothetical protein